MSKEHVRAFMLAFVGGFAIVFGRALFFEGSTPGEALPMGLVAGGGFLLIAVVIYLVQRGWL